MSAIVGVYGMSSADGAGGPRRLRLASRGIALAAALGLLGFLAGDGRATVTINGIDPLDVLNLKVRPNVLVVLDTSGSMNQSVDASNRGLRSGDHPRSKLRQAKEVLQSVIQANQNKVSFSYGQYAQVGSRLRDLTPRSDRSNERFRYVTNSFASPGMTNGQEILGELNEADEERGLQSWQDIQTAWNTLVFTEDTTALLAVPRVDATNNYRIYFSERVSATVWLNCTATLFSGNRIVYTGDAEVQSLLTRFGSIMSANNNGTRVCRRSDNGNAVIPQNDYSFTFTPDGLGSGFVSVQRTGGGRNWQQMLSGGNNNIRGQLGFSESAPGSPDVAEGTGVGSNPATTDGPFSGELLASVTTPSATTATCTFSVATQFYVEGDDLAAELQSRMASPTCTVPRSNPNVYRVTYDPDDGRFRFERASGSPSNAWAILWTQSSIAGALGKRGAGDTNSGTGAKESGDSYILLYRNDADDDLDFNETFDPDGAGPAVSQSIRIFHVRAWRLLNGETIRVTDDGEVCGLVSGAKTSPASFLLQKVADDCGADDGDPIRFDWAGGRYSSNDLFCAGYSEKVKLVPCDLDSRAPTQITTINPYVDLEFNFKVTPAGDLGMPAGDYQESQDGAYEAVTHPLETQGGGKAAGGTPIAESLIDLKVDVFEPLWNTGQAGTTSPSGPAPFQLDAIKDHVDPKEKTIVLFVTDGNDTCASDTGDGSTQSPQNALRAARKAEDLYTRIDPTEDASSVQTFVIGYGGAFTGGEATFLNWIAWGGSGLGPDLDGNGTRDVALVGAGAGERWTEGACGSDTACINTSLKNAKRRCSTCTDAFLAPDAETLRNQIQAIIDQGASTGEFSAAGGGAAASITEPIYEFVDLVPPANPTDPAFDPFNPYRRYRALVPVRFLSTFSLPGFKGQLRAFINQGGVAAQRWSAGDQLYQLVTDGMDLCTTGGNSSTTAGGAGITGQCRFDQLTNGEQYSDANPARAIKRRIFTTSQNGVFGVTVDNLLQNQAPYRIALWPPQTDVSPRVAPTDANEGLFDRELGLPLDGVADAAAAVTQLGDDFGACLGSNLPAGCTAPGDVDKMKAARREAREMILAYMAGAVPVRDDNSNPVRTAGASRSILYEARDWVLSESTLATPALVGPPIADRPEIFTGEYNLYLNGPAGAGAGQVSQGFGLRSPDGSTDALDTDTDLKPVMTVAYLGANDMLHAFRAGPNCAATRQTCDENGGQELWGFVPYDQVGKLGDRLRDRPETRANKNYMVASSVRFGDVFVPGPNPNLTIGGVAGQNIQGVWRKVIYFGRGIGGKYLSAIDVTTPGPFTREALETNPPIPLWNRGNPDTNDGLVGGSANNSLTTDDGTAYEGMGDTWSVPALAYVDRSANVTDRRTAGVDFVLYVGSGFGGTGEGTTFFTLDALTGDVVASVDVEDAAADAGLTRSAAEVTFPQSDGTNVVLNNAIVANPSAFAPGRFQVLTSSHPGATRVNRVYFGDLHGRLWKVLSSTPGVAIPAADLGATQPAATAAALIGLPPAPPPPAPPTGTIPFIYVTTGNDVRVPGPFHLYGFRDDGDDTDIVTAAPVDLDCPVGLPCSADGKAFPPVAGLFMRQFDQGELPAPPSGPALPESVFRGDIQPATGFECKRDGGGACIEGQFVGRVFIAASRLNYPNTAFAPPTPIKFGTGDYPCRSSFDSILYALGAETGLAAYDLNASGDDAYRIFRDSRLGSVGLIADPDPTRKGSVLNKEEGKVTGEVVPPPPPGLPPSKTTTQANVVLAETPGKPLPAVKFGSTVCQ